MILVVDRQQIVLAPVLEQVACACPVHRREPGLADGQFSGKPQGSQIDPEVLAIEMAETKTANVAPDKIMHEGQPLPVRNVFRG